MDWDKAIERNREALMRIVSSLFALVASARLGGAGLRGGSLMVPRRIWLAVLIVLRPAEAAVRRLVLIAARGLAPLRTVSRPMPAGGIARSDIPRAPVFGLIDPLRDLPLIEDDASPFYGVEFVNADADFASLPLSAPDLPMDAVRLHNRLRALRLALSDLARQARRLARWNARRDAALKAGQPHRLSPIRPGLPPGWRQRKIHEIDPLLRECHGLARDWLNAPDTS